MIYYGSYSFHILKYSFSYKFCVARERSIEDIEMSKANFDIIKGNKDNSTYRAKTVTATSHNSGKIELKWRAPEVRI